MSEGTEPLLGTCSSMTTEEKLDKLLKALEVYLRSFQKKNHWDSKEDILLKVVKSLRNSP